MNYKCNTPKSQHKYYLRTTHVIHRWHITSILSTNIVLHFMFILCYYISSISIEDAMEIKDIIEDNSDDFDEFGKMV